MSGEHPTRTLRGVLLDDEQTLSLGELCRVTDVQSGLVAEMVEEGRAMGSGHEPLRRQGGPGRRRSPPFQRERHRRGPRVGFAALTARHPGDPSRTALAGRFLGNSRRAI